MYTSLLSLITLNISLAILILAYPASAGDKFYPCAVVYDGGGLTHTNLVVRGNIAVRRLAGHGDHAAQVSTIIVSRGCVVAAYEDIDNEEEVFKFGSSCSADVLEQSYVIDSDTLSRSIISLHCYCVTHCAQSGGGEAVAHNSILCLISASFVIIKTFS